MKPWTLLLAWLLVAWGLGSAQTATAASGEPFDVAITDLSPTALAQESTVTVRGTVTNRDDEAWTSLQVYLAAPRNPFTSRDSMAAATSGASVYTGQRIVDVRYIDELGSLEPGKSHDFQITIARKDLPFSGAAGVYPLGVQVLATDPGGAREARAVGRATTFLPLVGTAAKPVPTTLVWPLLLASQRDADGRYPPSLVTALATGGQLNNLLHLAQSVPRNGSTVLLDPALLDAARDIAAGRHTGASREQRSAVATFADELVALAKAGSTWVLGYGQPDDVALSTAPRVASQLRDAASLATARTLDEHDLTARRASWLGPGDADDRVLAQLQRGRTEPVLIDAGALARWKDSLGSIVTADTTGGPLIVVDDLVAQVAGRTTAAVVRQAVAADAALAALSRAADPSSGADALAVVPPDWNPGLHPADLSAAFDLPFTIARTLDSRLTDTAPGIDPALGHYSATPVTRDVLDAADVLATHTARAVELSDGNPRLEAQLAREVALLASELWRGRPADAITAAHQRTRELDARVGLVTIEGPPSFTLSGTKGRFPLTITNGTDFPIRVGIDIESSNPALSVQDVKPIDIDAGERHTLTVSIDVGRQKSSTVTAHLVTVSGEHIGTPAEFNLRSSHVDSLVWLAMASAVLFVAFALFRRVRRRSPQ